MKFTRHQPSSSRVLDTIQPRSSVGVRRGSKFAHGMSIELGPLLIRLLLTHEVTKLTSHSIDTTNTIVHDVTMAIVIGKHPLLG